MALRIIQQRGYNQWKPVWMSYQATRSLKKMFSSGSQLYKAATDEVLLETREKSFVITLNRPKALNALNLNMIRQIYPKLKEWDEKHQGEGMILIKSTGEKAFCAGGDVRAIAEAGLRGEQLTKDFFREEYILNYLTGTVKTPYVALIDGITMGGGVGLSVHGPFRIATERTVFAMPETAIGLFPDVGGSHALPRLQGCLGIYLALTGFRLKGRDVKHAGIATHFVPSDQITDLEHTLLSLDHPNTESVGSVIRDYHDKNEDPDSQFSLHQYIDKINSLFNKNSVEDIVEALKGDGSEWALKQYETLMKMSPTSMKITLRQLQEGSKMSFADCFTMEYRMTQRCMADKDFFEGIRAVLVDKDNKPKWNPSTLEEVTQEKVDSYFAPLDKSLDLILK